MMQNRAKPSRRQKVTVRWLPVELIIEIFRRVQKLIGRCDFRLNHLQSARNDREYYDNLLAFALSSKEWTAIAQAELFRNIILKNRSKTGQFLKLVRENEQLRSHAESAISIRFGGDDEGVFDMQGLDDELDEIALYCPNVVEVSCSQVGVRLEYFGTSPIIIESEACALTMISARRKYEEAEKAQHRLGIYPTAFNLPGTNPTFHPPHYGILTP
jgi:hypothetical protein